LKILFYIDSLSSGGKERRLSELMIALKTIPAFEFELAIMSCDIHYQDVLENNIPIHYLLRKTKKDISVVLKLFKLCKLIKPDIVHCWDSMTAVYSIPVCKILRIPLVNGMVIDSPQKQNIFNKYWLRAKLTFPFSKSIIGNSKAGLVAYKSPLRKSTVIFNGFNFNRIKQVNDVPTIRKALDINTIFVIGMVASFSEYKDYKTYFEAAQLVLNSRTDVTFLAIGSNTDSILAENLIDRSNRDHFRLLGKKSGVESFINAMDICVLATFTEGISNSILEYMALGKPVIATSGGGTNEILENNKTGLLVEVMNPNDLAEKMLLLLQDESLRLEMGKAGKTRIKEVFSIETMLDKYILLYKHVMSIL